MFDMEKNFDDFLHSDIYDAAEQHLFDIIRSAYTAGWNAALGAQSSEKASDCKPSAVITLQNPLK